MDQTLLDKIAAMEKQVQAFHKAMDAHAKGEGLDDKTVLAALIGYLSLGISKRCGNDIADQDMALMHVMTGIQVCLAENGWRPMPDWLDIPDELVRRGPDELS